MKPTRKTCYCIGKQRKWIENPGKCKKRKECTGKQNSAQRNQESVWENQESAQGNQASLIGKPT